MIFFTADQHFNHANICKYTSRPWKTLEEMNIGLINAWNNVVGRKDTTYILGDFCFYDTRRFLAELSGKKILIVGSHDGDSLRPVTRDQFTSIHKGFLVIHPKEYPPIVLSHYSMRTWPQSHYGSWHFYGHSHGRLPSFGLSCDVGVDASEDYAPFNLEVLYKKFKTLAMGFTISE